LKHTKAPHSLGLATQETYMPPFGFLPSHHWQDGLRLFTKPTPYWPARVVRPKDAPNVLLIMTDDTGRA
jgi:hypothetical protein